ncbi:Rieske (2Fe-2S) protein [Kineococcus endophyticus]|uniref:Cytochrome bc1 complex Rieske iron-sulfur subunit n=1 Tax=Kineococcus endophyticus TaxID=1181883 RepID=A0ABV3P7Z3_9ACTN
MTDDRKTPHPLQNTVLTRRGLAVTGGTLGVGSLLAACGSDDASTSPGAASSSSTSSSASSSSAPTSSAGGSASASGGQALTKLADVPVGSGVVVQDAKGSAVVVVQPEAGQVAAFSGLCTHQGCAVALKDEELDCPCHGSRFELLTGKVLQGPATEPLKSLPVQVDGDSVVASA